MFAMSGQRVGLASKKKRAVVFYQEEKTKYHTFLVTFHKKSGHGKCPFLVYHKMLFCLVIFRKNVKTFVIFPQAPCNIWRNRL